MTRDGSTFARWAMRGMVVASRPRSPNSARAASRMRWAVAARFAALLVGSLTSLTRTQRDRVESGVPRVGRIVEQRHVVGPTAHQLGQRGIGDLDLLPRLRGGFVPAYLGL